jgi:hypothetical protein
MLTYTNRQNDKVGYICALVLKSAAYEVPSIKLQSDLGPRACHVGSLVGILLIIFSILTAKMNLGSLANILCIE